jgi:hypothetical protein
MGYLTPSYPPHPLDWVEFWGIRWEENTSNTMVVFDKEIFEISRSMPSGIVHNHEYLPFGLIEEKAHKTAECIGVEGGSLFRQEATCFEIECTKEPYLLAGRGKDYLRLVAFGSPHPS